MPQNHEQLPRLLLVSDAPLARNGLGIDRTLYSLFEDYPPDRFLLYTRGRTAGPGAAEGDFVHRSVAFPHRYVRPILTRFTRGRVISAFHAAVSTLDFTCRAWKSPAGLDALRAFDPQLIVICPNCSIDLIEGYKAATALRRPFVVYFMDDWPAIEHHRWFGGDIQAIVRESLRRADGWIMISEALAQRLGGRYGVKQDRTLIAHNTVTIDERSVPDFSARTGTFRIAYAGSIWPMHFDAIAVVAEGMAQLAREGEDVDFVVYCPEQFWTRYGEWLGARGVRHGGFVPHDRLMATLRESDLLLVASSFKEEHAPMTHASVQTKLTDYMCAGRAILSVGPPDGACNRFVERWKCGLVSTAETPQAMATELRAALRDRPALAGLARHAHETARRHFARQTVVRELHEFLAGVARQAATPDLRSR